MAYGRENSTVPHEVIAIPVTFTVFRTQRLFDAQGRLAYQEDRVPPGRTSLLLHHLVSGVYWARIETEQGVFWGKWVKR